MIYAPVLIPTLNRYDHLRRCLESLSRCSWAEYTDVFVALDYPPEQNREKYEDGWRQNRAYLRSLQGGVSMDLRTSTSSSVTIIMVSGPRAMRATALR